MTGKIGFPYALKLLHSQAPSSATNTTSPARPNAKASRSADLRPVANLAAMATAMPTNMGACVSLRPTDTPARPPRASAVHTLLRSDLSKASQTASATRTASPGTMSD